MALTYDDVARMLARQVLGDESSDNLNLARNAMDLGLDKIAQNANLVSQEKKSSFTSTGAVEYDWTASPLSLTDYFRAVKLWTVNGPLKKMAHEEFVERYPDYLVATAGIPQFFVQWGENNLIVWPDTSGDLIYYSYYALISQNKANRVLSVLYDVARHYLENKPETRAQNWQIAQTSVRDAERANDRSVGTPVRFLEEERVTTLRRWKRGRRCP